MYHTWLEISTGALRHNIEAIRGLIGTDVKLMAVVKANAYGHGLTEVGEAIQNKVDYLAVANYDEALALRRAGIRSPILVLAYFPEDAEIVNWCIRERVELTIHDFAHAERVSKLAKDGELRVHIKIDTGMGRLGILDKEAVEEIKKIDRLLHINIKGIFSHLADAFHNVHYTNEQLEKFAKIKKELTRAGFDRQIYHLANTAAILTLPESHHEAVRLGLGLYGLYPDAQLPDWMKKDNPGFALKPALTWKTKILQIKDYPAGGYIGYGCTYQTKRPTRLAIIPMGYYEGWSRGLSEQGEVLITGRRCRIVGRICMNIFMVDVTDLQTVSLDDEVILIGRQNEEEITVDEIAARLDTINYEVAARINPLIKRVYVE